MRIERVNPRSDTEQLETCYRLAQSAGPEDDPTRPPVSMRRFRSWAYGPVDGPQHMWLAADDAGEAVGYYMLTLPERENAHSAFFEGGPRGRWPVVAPTRRRAGIGSALLAHAAEQAERAGRSLLVGGSRAGGPGAAFAEACGARAGMTDVRRVLDLDAHLLSNLPSLRAIARPYDDGYRLRFWSGPTPDELIGPACALYDAMQDSPHDAAFEPLVWDAERLRDDERKSVELGLCWHRVAAIADASGEIAGLTEVEVDPDTPEWGHQGLTAVSRPHRGRRLGLAVKVAMLAWLAETQPRMQHVFTHNAAQNKHMIAVNEQLGYRVSGVFQNWEIAVATALKLAG